ncbi:MAG: PAS domain-containing protein [Myxococcota bacterium]|nr:PAS domain-containing protein [Myxococcota bacterium]
MTGTGTDGMRGIQAVKAQGGTVVVQDPDSAAFNGMPQSAIGTGLVDLVLPVHEIPPRLAEFAKHPYTRNPIEPQPQHEKGLQGVLSLLRARNGHDFRAYKENTLIRRVQRRMGLEGKTKIDEYAQLLREDPQELQRLQMDLLISVTSLFRDPDAYTHLEKAVRPAFENKHDDKPVRAWVAGCATGDEAYSVAMILLEARDSAGAKRDVQLFATDLSNEAIAIARTGNYPEGALAEVSDKRRDEFFAKTDTNDYRIKKEIRDAIVFATHNLLVDPPFFNLDLITCRNVLIYLKPDAQKKVLSLFHAALKPNGLLFLGSAETVGIDSGFETVSAKARIYRRVGPARRPYLSDAEPFRKAPTRPAPKANPGATGRAQRAPATLTHIANDWLLDTYAPAIVLVDDHHKILYLHGPVGKYLDLPRGEARLDLMAMPRPGLSARLRVALFKAKREKRPIKIDGVHIKRDGRTHPVNVTIKPAPCPPFAPGLLLVSFEDAAEPRAGTSRKTSGRKGGRGSTADEALAAHLEAELSATKRDLQGNIEALEATNEELKASNEEMMSMNEEFRSTNEELETSKEEMQSLNEELGTVNAQLKDKTETLEGTNDDLINLLRSTDVATIFLDRKFRISRFTPATRKLFNLIPSDVGRPLSDISRKFTDDDLTRDAEVVLMEASSIEKLVRASEGRWYLRRVQPYRTQDGRLTGTVVTFVDVDALKVAELSMRAAKKYAENIVATIREPLLVLDADLRVKSANHAFYELFRVDPNDTVGSSIFDLGNGQWNIPKLRDALRWILPHGDEMRDLEVEHTFDAIGERTMLLNAKRVSLAEEQEDQGEDLVLLALEDITQRRAAERALKDLTIDLEQRVKERTGELEATNAVLRHANESLDAFTYVVGHDLKEPTRAVETLLTLLEEDHAGRLPEDVRTLLAKARAANRRLSALVTGLLAFSRASRADVTNTQPLVLHDALHMDDCTTRFRDRVAERGARLEYPGRDIIVHAHLPAVCQILGNIIENAVKHNPNPQPLVRVSAKTAPDGSMVEVVVEDNGPGFPPDVVAGLERMTTATRGFGLAIAKRTVELSGGKLWLGQSAEGGGAVHFTLPARADAPGASKTRAIVTPKEQQLLFEHAPGLFLILEPRPPFHIIAASSDYLQATMTTREGILGRGIFEVFPDNPDDHEATGVKNLSASLERVIQSRNPDPMAIQKYDIRKPKDQGSTFEERYWSPINSPIIDEAGQLAFIIHRVEDVTEIARAKKDGDDHSKVALKLRESIEQREHEISLRSREAGVATEQLRETVAKLEETNRALLLANEGLESFAYVVSHDLREPVRAIQATQALIQEKDLAPEVRELVARNRESTTRLAKLLQGLLDVSRASQFDPHELRLLNLVDVLKSDTCKARYDSLFDEKHVELTIQAGPPGVTAYATPHHVSEIFGNLLLNAAKHNTNPNPRVHVEIIEAPEDAGRVLITIEDNGPGFDEKLVEQLDHLKPGRPATLRGGFGLIIARRAVDRLGGTMTLARSERLGGAAVHVALPAAPPSPPQ